MAQRTYTDDRSKHLEPPHSLDAEQAVLGSMLKDAEATSRVIEILPNESFFYYPKHRAIFAALLALYERSEPCDITTVANVLVIEGELEKIGGRVYLVDLAENVASPAHVEAHAKIVLDNAVLRNLINTSGEIVTSCYAQEGDVGELLDLAESNIFKISEFRLRKGFVSVGSLVGPLIKQVEEFASTGGGAGLHTGYTQLDEMTNGLQKGELIVIAGRPSMGKTAFALNIAENVSRSERGAGVGVGIFSIEMSDQALTLRLLSSRARLSQQKIRAGKLSNEEWQRFGVCGGALSEARIFIDDSPTLSPLELRAKARRLKSAHDVGLIIVDYIQLMHSPARAENRQQEIALVSRNLKALAKELDIPVIAISQLSRMVEQRGGEKRPQLSDLRESGAIEQDADLVMFLYRPEFYFSKEERMDIKNQDKIGVAEVIIAKQRNGPTGTSVLTFMKDYTRFENRETTHYELPADAQGIEGGDTPF